MTHPALSPLRYPGGKQILGRVLAHLIRLNGSAGGMYVEPYAGGAGIALALLFGEHVERVIINDVDPCIYAFWSAVLNHTEKFVRLLKTTPATVNEWARQRNIYQHPARYSTVRVAFATFYLNRCNRSGIIATGGPIGGQRQEGRWKIDARFNREELERRIRRIALYRDRISISNADAIDLLRGELRSASRKIRTPFVYLDPPYYAKGRDLYLNFYSRDDHAKLAAFMTREDHYPWILSYDNVPEIRRLYASFRQVRFSLDYSATERREGSEVMIFRPDVGDVLWWARVRSWAAGFAFLVFLIATSVMLIYHILTAWAYFEGFRGHRRRLRIALDIADEYERMKSEPRFSGRERPKRDDIVRLVEGHGLSIYEAGPRDTHTGHAKRLVVAVRPLNVPVWSWVYPDLDKGAEVFWQCDSSGSIVASHVRAPPKEVIGTLGSAAVLAATLAAIASFTTVCLAEVAYQTATACDRPDWTIPLFLIPLALTLLAVPAALAGAKTKTERPERGRPSGGTGGPSLLPVPKEPQQQGPDEEKGHEEETCSPEKVNE